MTTKVKATDLKAGTKFWIFTEQSLLDYYTAEGVDVNAPEVNQYGSWPSEAEKRAGRENEIRSESSKTLIKKFGLIVTFQGFEGDCFKADTSRKGSTRVGLILKTDKGNFTANKNQKYFLV